jgi:hypothetical protein
MSRTFAGLITLLVPISLLASTGKGTALPLPANAGAPRTEARDETPKKEPPKKEEPSIHGTWVGYWTVINTKVKFISTLRPDGTYRTIMESGDYVTVERGKYKYSDGTLETEPESGVSTTFTVTFEDKNTMRVKGGGLAITYKRQ